MTIDGMVINLQESKTGPRKIYLSPEAKTILDQIAARREMTPLDRQEWVFGGKIKVSPYSRFGSVFALRQGGHTFASQAALMGHSLIEIKMMLGHKRLEMTMHYVHIADPETYKASTLMAETLNNMLEG